jgi:hypothetical protein
MIFSAEIGMVWSSSRWITGVGMSIFVRKLRPRIERAKGLLKAA